MAKQTKRQKQTRTTETFTQLRRDQEVHRIAREVLGLETLATRKSDSLDFSDQAVWAIREALEAAYQAGRASMAPALVAVKQIADADGLGDDDATSEPAYRLLCQAVADATNAPCTGFLGTFQPEVK